MDVEIKDIPESMINMVDIVGIRKFLEITKIYGGASVYIPLYKSIIRPARDRDIIKKYSIMEYLQYFINLWCYVKI